MQQEAGIRLSDSVKDIPNLVQALFRNVERRPEKTALAYKAGGGWREISYRELGERVERFAAGMAALGVERGDRMALMSANRPEWAISDYAIQSLGAATVPIYPTLEPHQIEHILEDSEARAVIVENEELLRRVREVQEDFPVVVMDDAFTGENEKTLRFESVYRSGEERPKEDWREVWGGIGRDEVATILYTSGTTGAPKGVILTHDNILSNIEGIVEAVPLRPEDVFLSLLPLSHIFERTAGQFVALTLGCSIYYAESIEKVPENLREVRPTVVPSVPRLYEKMYDRVQQRLSQGPALRRKLAAAAIAAGREKYRLRLRGREPGAWLRFKLGLFERLVFNKIREATGGRLRFFVSGGAKLEAEIGEFFYAAGVPILEGYGLTETSPVISCNRLGREKFGTVGLPLFNVEVRIGEHGEIQTRGPHVMRGYFNLPEETEAAFTEDGWFKTGDIGEIDDEGYLKITDRLKNLIVLSTGKNVAPQPIETKLVTMPHISQAVLLGDGRKYVSALIVPDYEAVRNRLATDAAPAELAEDERVRELIQKDIDTACAEFADYERPKKFALLAREFSQEEGELTPTLKVKMRVVQERYAGQIERLYAGS
ncbi:long-chain fatty acid--CoA ligase [Rubrobacter taiwanensis]|jgi:long-chain acyl-CoA synthetase|uniref:Long-chain fatty acid--CoA ligase n=1 Tax=Rubrobacter taiwanensis TaxID=185139 RepID=A0A4R1BCQ0_9ACTN|nr:long-chain fatty acid--CoA ligase [Rubrobacter taiwanensis]TCJ14826.1 long-chain fatty acid--CoA ligase [Rubrobacter taiwanensis]